MLPKEKAFPAAQGASTAGDGERDRRLGRNRAAVRGHAVRTFAIVDEGEIAVGNGSGGKVLEIAADGRVSVLADAAPVLREGLRRLRPLRNSPGTRVEAAVGRPGKP